MEICAANFESKEKTKEKPITKVKKLHQYLLTDIN